MCETEPRTALRILADVKEEMRRLSAMREGGFVPNRKAVDKFVMEALTELTLGTYRPRISPMDSPEVEYGEPIPYNSSQVGMITKNIMRHYRRAMGDSDE